MTCAFVSRGLPAGSPVEPAPAWIGSPTFYSVHWLHSTVDIETLNVNLLCKPRAWKNSYLIFLFRAKNLFLHTFWSIKGFSLKTKISKLSDFFWLIIQHPGGLCHSASQWSKVITAPGLLLLHWIFNHFGHFRFEERKFHSNICWFLKKKLISGFHLDIFP